MDYKEIHGDLFKLPENYYLCHCISSDFKLGLGIAAEFDKRFDMRRKLFSKYQPNVFKPCALLVDNVFNLVTKEKYWYKPTYQTLRESLIDLRNQVEKLDIKYLGMPVIGCGLDKLEWYKVSKIIQEIFSDLDINIRVVKKG